MTTPAIDPDEAFANNIRAASAAAPLGGRFTDVELLRRADGTRVGGNFSVMFSARDLRTNSIAILKFLKPGADSYRTDCFNREVEVSKALVGRENITQLVSERDVLVITGQSTFGLPLVLPCPYFALERGRETLEAFLVGRRRPKPLYRRLEVVRDVVKGVNRLHALGFCHRDLKPDNVLLFSGGRAKLADLGTARRIDGSDRLTHDYFLPQGHMLYAAPEMFSGGGFTPELFVGADWFGVGAILFEAATNQNVWIAIGLTSPLQIKRTVAAAMGLQSYLAQVGRAASMFPIPATMDYANEEWLRPVSERTHGSLTALIRSLCNFDYRRRLVSFPTILRRLDVTIALARRDHRRYFGVNP
ncbi:MAG: protein kinase family protein [Gemmatimonadaceae bacterium]